MSEPGKQCLADHGIHPDGQPRSKPAVMGWLCQNHWERLNSDVQEVETLWCELNLVIDHSAPKEETGKSRKVKAAEAPAPLDLTAVALRDPRTKAHRIPALPGYSPGDNSEPMPAVPAVVASWLTLVADEHPIPGPLPKGAVPQLRMLAKQHAWVAGQEWVDDYARELTEMRKALKAAVRDRTHWYLGRCMLTTDDGSPCGGALLRENGSGVVSCRACAARWVTPQEQARLSVMLEDEAKARYAEKA